MYVYFQCASACVCACVCTLLGKWACQYAAQASLWWQADDSAVIGLISQRTWGEIWRLPQGSGAYHLPTHTHAHRIECTHTHTDTYSTTNFLQSTLNKPRCRHTYDTRDTQALTWVTHLYFITKLIIKISAIYSGHSMLVRHIHSSIGMCACVCVKPIIVALGMW